ncbi:hypothetical protein [Bacillus sp. 3255]|uniref:hypothetical protein n=1 Tax=Bacillus sp. 3255 TaxID=2817904 RepID=UPI0028582621|nr:hypothetical protein [Bacillus sp. 3255]MDR6879302.1 hypothetical protein [Bacillus sp. 3255]
MMKSLFMILFFIAVLTGCSPNTEAESSSIYPSAIAWNNVLYGLSSEEIAIHDIGKEIGKIERRIAPMPKKSGDSNDKPVGSLFFEVKGTDVQEVVAVKVNDKYFKASKLGPLK